MNIEFVGLHVELGEDIRDYAQKKLAKAVKFLEEPIEIRVTLQVEKHRKTAEIRASHRFGIIQAAEETNDARDAINLAVDKIEKQARRAREKAKGRKRRSQSTRDHVWPVDVLDAETLQNDSGPKVVKSSKLAIKPMSLEEAALALENSKNEFVVYRDAESDRVHVLYRRRDQNYGLIAPEL